MDKFSELKAAAMAATPGPWITIDYFWIGRAGAINSEFITCDNGPDADYIKRVSPDVVLALLAELEAKSLECRGIEQERELFRVERIAHQQYAQELEQRVAELSELETHNQSLIKKNADLTQQNIKLGERLATPVRLPRPACTYADHSYPAYSRKQVEEILSSAGMHFTVEGDE